MPVFYIVATPVGNLADISARARKTLEEVDLILCEDTRVTKKLLNRYDIRTQTLSYHQHSKAYKTERVLNFLKEGKNLALVSDAGTPGISDPGGKLIEKVVELFGGKIKIVPVPGACAAVLAASVSGMPVDKFLFLGFPPARKKRKKFFKEVMESKYTVIFYESPHRILKSLGDLQKAEAEMMLKKKRKAMVCREMTKKFETIYRGSIEKVIKEIEKDKVKGEFVVVVGK